MNPPIDWLLEGEPWVEYRTRRDLLGQLRPLLGSCFDSVETGWLFPTMAIANSLGASRTSHREVQQRRQQSQDMLWIVHQTPIPGWRSGQRNRSDDFACPCRHVEYN